jgi:general secretion pathway protein L
MKRQVLGLDINDEFVAATIVEMRGQDPVVTSSGFALYHDKSGLAEILPQLLQEVRWKGGGTCIAGISLCGVSLRNITLPFTESRKIAQILPLELEDQLLSPVSHQLVEYKVSKVEEEQSHLLVTTVAKERVKECLDLLSANKITPEIVTLRTQALAEQLQRQQRQPGNFLLIDAGLYAASIAFVIDRQVVFLRRVVYADRIFTSHPLVVDENGPSVVNRDEVMECISALCRDIKVSVGLFQLESGMNVEPEQTILTGVMAAIPDVSDQIASELGKEVTPGDIRQHVALRFSSGLEEKWSPYLHDHALALALQGFRKKATVNFRKDEFALPKLYYASKNQLAAAAVVVVALLVTSFIYLGYDYRALRSEHDELGERMNALFRETFPEATRIVDPLVQMKTNLRDVQAPAIATPIFSGDKRLLSILADISGRIPGSVKIDVARMVIDEKAITIKGTTDTFNNVNLIQNVLRKSPVYRDVDIVSAAADKDGDSIRFELKLQTVKTS